MATSTGIQWPVEGYRVGLYLSLVESVKGSFGLPTISRIGCICGQASCSACWGGTSLGIVVCRWMTIYAHTVPIQVSRRMRGIVVP